MIGRHPSEVVRVVGALLAPFVGVYGAYVIAHGHYGPGGGFVGGAILAVAAILLCLTAPGHATDRAFPPRLAPISAAVGVVIYLACGVVPMLLGGSFLDYGAMALGSMEPSRARYLAILVVEIGVGLAVFGAMLAIFDRLTGRCGT